MATSKDSLIPAALLMGLAGGARGWSPIAAMALYHGATSGRRNGATHDQHEGAVLDQHGEAAHDQHSEEETAHNDAADGRGAWREWPMFNSKLGRGIMIGLGAMEYAFDKFPWTQSRTRGAIQLYTSDTGLVGRTIVTAIAGGALGSELGGTRSIATGAAFAGLAAVIGNYVGHDWRKAIVDHTRAPDYAVALGEDAACILLLNAAIPER